MSTTWWAGLSPVELPVDCAGTPHHIRWAAGRIEAPDHPDADGERTLAALGGEGFPCLDIIDTWTRHSDDLDVLLLAGRGPGDPVNPAPPMPRRSVAYASTLNLRWQAPPAAGGWVRAGQPHHRGAPPQDEIEAFLTLGGGLPDRLAATDIATWADRLENTTAATYTTAALPALHAALYGRATAAIRDWLGTTDLNIDVQIRPTDAEPGITRESGTVQLEVPFTWLRDVWAPGLTTILGRFTLAATCTEPDEWTITSVDTNFGPPQTITIRLHPRPSE